MIINNENLDDIKGYYSDNYKEQEYQKRISLLKVAIESKDIRISELDNRILELKQNIEARDFRISELKKKIQRLELTDC